MGNILWIRHYSKIRWCYPHTTVPTNRRVENFIVMFVKVKQCSCVGAIGRYCNEGSPASPSFAPFLLIRLPSHPLSHKLTPTWDTCHFYLIILSFYYLVYLFLFLIPLPSHPHVSQAHTNLRYMLFCHFCLIILLFYYLIVYLFWKSFGLSFAVRAPHITGYVGVERGTAWTLAEASGWGEWGGVHPSP